MQSLAGENEYQWDIYVQEEDFDYTVSYPKDPSAEITINEKTKGQWQEYLDNLYAEAANRIKGMLATEGITDDELIYDYIDYTIDEEIAADIPEDVRKIMDNLIENVVKDDAYIETTTDITLVTKYISAFDEWEGRTPEDVAEEFEASVDETDEFDTENL